MNFNLHNKTFASLINSTNGEVCSDTLFNYYQDGLNIWADYAGGSINRGSLIGKFVSENELEFNYQHINQNGELKAGFCKTVFTLHKSGKLKLSESWQWFTGDHSSGHSVLIEQ